MRFELFTAQSTLSDLLGVVFYFFVLMLFLYQIRQIRSAGAVIFFSLFGMAAFLLVLYLYGLIEDDPDYRPLEWVLNTVSVLLLIITVILMIHNFSGQVDLSLLRNLKKDYKEKDLLFYSTILSKKIYKAVFQDSNMGVAIINRYGKPIITNTYLQQLLQYTDQELAQKNFLDFSYPEDAQKDRALFQQLLANEIEFYEIDKRYVKKNGDVCWANLQVSKATDSEILTIVKDITDRIQLNEDLIEKEQKLAGYTEELRLKNEILLTSQEKAGIGHWSYDVETEKTLLSSVIYDIYGIPEGSELSVREGINFYRKDFRKTIKEAFQKLLTEQQEYDLELVLVSKEGNEHWVRTIGYPVTENGKVVAARGLFLDIHENKLLQLEKEKRTGELLAANRKIQLAQSVMGFGIWSFQPQTGELDMDDGMYELFRKDRKTDPDILWKNLIHDEDRFPLYKAFVRVLRQKGKFEHAFRLRLPDQSLRHIQTKVESFADSKGAVNLIIGTCTDVTEEYLRIQELKKIERTISEAQAIANFGYFSYDITEDFLTWSVHMDSIFEQPEDFDFTLEAFLGTIYPEDRQMAIEEISYSIKTGAPIDLKHRITTPAGTMKSLYHQAKVYQNDKGEPYKIVGITQDLTTEIELQRQLEKNLITQRIVTEFALRLNNPGDFDDRLSSALALLGESLKMDRVFVLETQQSELKKKFEWSQDNISSPEAHSHSLPELLINSLDAIDQESSHLISIGKEDPEDWKKDLLNQRDAGNILLTKFIYNDSSVVFLGLEKIEGSTLPDDSQINLVHTSCLFIRNFLKEHADAERLQSSESKFKNLARSITDPYIALDHDFNYLYLNTAAEKFGEFIINPIGQNLVKMQVGPLNKTLIAHLTKLNAESQSTHLIRKYRNQHLELSVYRGEIGFSIIIKDITERFNLQRSLEITMLKYESLYHRTPAMMHSINRDGKIINVSAYWLEKMGYRKNEVLGKNSVDFLSSRSKKTAHKNFIKLQEEGQLKNIPLEFIKKSGERMDVLLSATTELDNKGAAKRTMAVITDVTAERAAEAEIKRMNRELDKKVKERTKELLTLSEELFERTDFLNAFIQKTDSLIHICDLEGRFLLVNRQFAAVHNLKGDEELIGTLCSKLYDQKTSEKVRQLHQYIQKEDDLVTREEVLTLRGKEAKYLTTSFPLKKQQGKIYAIASISVDITRLKEQQQKLTEKTEELRLSNEILLRQKNQLAQQHRKLRDANMELESFSYSVSHDLRSPLRAIEAFSRLLNEKYTDTLDENGRKWLNFINSNAHKMDALINDILTFSRISRSEIEKKEFDTTTLVKAIIADERNNYPEHKFVIEMEPLMNSFGDIRALKQVWVNLISNAFKYSSKKEVIRVWISSRVSSGSTLFEVRDEGAGFNEEYQSKLFAVFQRLHNEKDFSGTGVGLAIVRKIIERHNGAIMASGEEGKGATFTFSIPNKDTDQV